MIEYDADDGDLARFTELMAIAERHGYRDADSICAAFAAVRGVIDRLEKIIERQQEVIERLTGARDTLQ
jgi:hypothetical protein